MRRCSGGMTLVAICAAVLLVLAAPAMAGQSPSTAPTGNGVIKGVVLDYAGLPVPGAHLMWLTGDSRPSGGAQTDSTGSYEITGVSSLAGTGQLWMWSGRDEDPVYKRRGLTFLDPGPSTFDFWPGRLPLSIQRGGPWSEWSHANVGVYGSDPAAPDSSTDQDVALRASEQQFEGYAYALPGDYTSAVVTFHGGGWPSRRTEALEIQMPQGTPAVVQSGQTAGVSLIADERDAGRAEVTRWASGAPGSRVILRLSNLRSGDAYKITGESMNGHEPEKTFATVAVPSPAPAALSLRVRVPLGAPAGDKYNFAATRVGGHLRLVASYQVCAFTASSRSIPRGAAVKLRGRVPVIPDNNGRNTMTLTLFKHAGVVGQPWTWQAKGWTKVTTIRTGFQHLQGRFSTPWLHPRRTTSYVIRYPRSSDPSWRGFTSVETVYVH